MAIEEKVQKKEINKKKEKQSTDDSTMLLVLREDQLSLHKKISELSERLDKATKTMSALKKRVKQLEKKDTPVES
jgi:hypothetical protein